MSEKTELQQVMMTVDDMNRRIQDFQKAVTSADTAFPVRENLAAEAKLVVPVDTPVLNWLPTKPGAGKAAAWKEIASFGTDPSSVFYTETTQPSARTTTYADRSESYKLLGLDGGVTNFAVAAGANYQDQLALEKRNTLLHLKRLEEDALINAPGTGNTFNGIRTQITTGNGSFVMTSQNSGVIPSALTDDLATFLRSAWDKGGLIDNMVVRSSEASLITKSVTRDNQSAIRVSLADNRSPEGLVGGFFVNRYMSPIDGSIVFVTPDKFHINGEILGLCSQMPAPIPGQGGEGLYLDLLLDYAMSDVPTSTDQTLFRIVRYYTLPMPARKFMAKMTGF